MHQFKNGRFAAEADGWCISCLLREPLPGLKVCQSCRERRNQWSLNRNAAQPTAKRTRKKYQAAFDQV